ncbi:MAG: hypothetical protein Q8M83_05480 [bacterium]|nr:hypothetical protein [bacterium]
MKDFKVQKDEIKKLHKKYEGYLKAEYSGRDYFCYLSNPKNFIDGVYYHQANFKEENKDIIKNGFDETKVSRSNCGAGRGLYLGRDKNALINFYSNDINNPQNFVIKIKGDFNFLDLLDNQEFLQKNKNEIEGKVLSMGYDGIRYYDPDATGEEFVLFNYSKILIEK